MQIRGGQVNNLVVVSFAEKISHSEKTERKELKQDHKSESDIESKLVALKNKFS